MADGTRTIRVRIGAEAEIAALLALGRTPKDVVAAGYAKSTVYKVAQVAPANTLTQLAGRVARIENVLRHHRLSGREP